MPPHSSRADDGVEGQEIRAIRPRGAGQADVLATLDSLDRQVGALSARLAALTATDDDYGNAARYPPVPPTPVVGHHRVRTRAPEAA